LTALRHRSATGKGQHVDLSQMITGITLTGPALLDKTVNGRQARREGFPPGNRTVWPGAEVVNNYRGPIAAPHNAYRTAPGGYNDWATIACLSDDEWQKLAKLMGNPDWADDRFDTINGRLEHQEEMDGHIEKWTETMGKYELTEKCQTAGIRAMAVQSSQDRVDNDPQLRHRDMYVPMEHPMLGPWKFQNAPFKLSKSPARMSSPPPMIGQHNRDVLEDLLGVSHDDLLNGYENGVLWPTTMDRYPYIEEALR
jgi:crotonobetainyl-CoA:carnitine CoA-transferase CaiB-like acyl-CoA transferase